MKSLIQRVNKASVSINGEVVGAINKGICVLLGIRDTDNEKDIDYLINKITTMRFFSKEESKFSATLEQVNGGVLLVSQFTLYANLRKGTRPSFTSAMLPEQANQLYELFITKLRKAGINVETGEFGAYMQVNIDNDGPVTLDLNSDHLEHHV
ncbi:D-tyrosyl-tRNA(Tyr) deacylase [Candidatus Dojkabacteria bacterium]|uniref:D-aminoacyl-tRNA deacylase n=1 Tax=Candidatus Dojkabacteria bacterium TaxID=2099670 RepID=A0A955L6B4_9BACT|nr:D-tyrosyl-tRNA(Tyr) deacylase [Candidatus Dojkabacteria bacterium]